MDKKLLLVTDVPSPYRIHLFNALHEELSAAGAAFEVLFMARTSPIRYWGFDKASCAFAYRIVSGVHPRYRNDLFHFNPGILSSVLKEQPTWLVIGGAWNMPTVIALVLMRAFHRRKGRTILWSEANYNAMLFKEGLIPKIRAAIVRRVDAFAVPGRVAEATIKNNWKVTDKPFLLLPNLVDERLFKDEVTSLRNSRKQLRQKRNLGADDMVLLWPARLHEETKGLINFLSAVAEIIPPSIRILVVGEGSDRPRIEDWLKDASLNNVILLGHRSQSDMIELYALSDALLLPSLRDPNPLSVIEGLWAGLPLFISCNCGNWAEALEGGANGWMVDPLSVQSMRAAFIDLLGTSSERLIEYGSRSRRIAEQYFSTSRCVQRFVRELIAGAAAPGG